MSWLYISNWLLFLLQSLRETLLNLWLHDVNYQISTLRSWQLLIGTVYHDYIQGAVESLKGKVDATFNGAHEDNAQSSTMSESAAALSTGYQ